MDINSNFTLDLPPDLTLDSPESGFTGADANLNFTIIESIDAPSLDTPALDGALTVEFPLFDGGGSRPDLLAFDPEFGNLTGGTPELSSFIGTNLAGVDLGGEVDEDVFQLVSVLRFADGDAAAEQILGNPDVFGSITDPGDVVAIAASETGENLVESDVFLNAIASNPQALALWLQQPAFAEALAGNPIAQNTINSSNIQQLNNPPGISPQVLQDNAPDLDGDGIRELNSTGGARMNGGVDADDLDHIPALSTFSPIQLTPANSAQPGAAVDSGDVLSGYNPPGLEGLRVYPIESFEAYSALTSSELPEPVPGQPAPERPPAPPAPITSAEALQPTDGQVATNGTYNDGIERPAGPVIHNGDILSTGLAESARRSGVAEREDGTIVVGTQFGTSEQSVQDTFGAPGNEVVEFMGGGAAIIRNGTAVPDAEFNQGVGVGGQHFDQPGESGRTGIDSGQLGGGAPRTLVGIRDGVAYALVTDVDKTVPEVRDQLLAQGFTEVVVFDGGRQGYLNDPSNPNLNIDGRSKTENEAARTGFLFDVFESVLNNTPSETNSPNQP